MPSEYHFIVRTKDSEMRLGSMQHRKKYDRAKESDARKVGMTLL